MSDDVKRLRALTHGQFFRAANAGNLAIDAVLADIKDVLDRLEAAESELALVSGSGEPGKPLFALLYLVDWDEPIDGKQPVYPDCHAVYRTREEAEAVRRTMTLPDKYWTVRARWEDPARLAAAPLPPNQGGHDNGR